MTLAPESEIVADWTEFGHHFQIERLDQPRRVGASERTHRLWENGEPSLGGQWAWSEDCARRRAAYITQGSLHARIKYLELQVGNLERRLAEAKADA